LLFEDCVATSFSENKRKKMNLESLINRFIFSPVEKR